MALQDNNLCLLNSSNYNHSKLKNQSDFDLKLKGESFLENTKNNSITDSNELSKRNNNTKANLLNENTKEITEGNGLTIRSLKDEQLEEKNKNNLILPNDTRLMKILNNLKEKDLRKKFSLNIFEVFNFLKVSFFGSSKLNNKFKKNFKILKEGEEKISQYLNLFKIIEKFERIDYIAKLMFKDYQKSILDIIDISTLDISETILTKAIPKSNSQDPNLNKYFKDKELNRNNRKLCSQENIKAISLFLIHYNEDHDSKNKYILSSLLE